MNGNIQIPAGEHVVLQSALCAKIHNVYKLFGKKKSKVGPIVSYDNLNERTCKALNLPCKQVHDTVS